MLVETPVPATTMWPSFVAAKQLERSERKYRSFEGELRFELDGTAVTISAPGLSTDELVEIAEALVRVPE